MDGALALDSFTPVVRYVDDERAVVDARVTLTGDSARWLAERRYSAQLMMHIHGSDGFYDEANVTLPPGERTGMHRFEIVQPERWWPAGMGEQPLYNLAVHAYVQQTHHLERQVHFGLTSVRPAKETHAVDEPALLVNGQPIALHSVVRVDRVDEDQLLPATGDSLLLVTDHYAPDVLYQAADQAGILLVQCVPIDPTGQPELSVQAQLDRLMPHPSLAGYFVGHLGRLREQLARQLRELDPARVVFRDMPGRPAA